MRAARHILLPVLAVASIGVAAMATTASGQSTSNLVPAQSSCFASSGSGLWQAWYGSSISRSTAESYGGCAASLAVQATEAQYVGVNWNNSPGVTGATAGTPYTLSYAAYGQAGTTFTAEFSWYNGASALSTNDLNVTTNGGWAAASETVTSPAKATGLFLDVRTTNAVNGAVYYLDDFQAVPNGAPTTTTTTTVAPTTTTTVAPTTTTTVARTTTTTVAPSTTNLVPAQSSCFASSGSGLWQAWYGSSISRSTAESYGGCAASLAVQATEAQYVGVNWNNSPGVTGATAGTPYTLSYAAYGQAGTTFTAEFSWYNGASALSTNDLNVTTNGGWAAASETVTSPAKATGLFLDVRTTNAVNGAVYYLDDFQAVPNGAPTTTTTTTVAPTTTTTVARTTTTTVAPTTTTTTPSGQTCTHPVWSSSSAAGSDSNFPANSGGDYWSVNNDAWNGEAGPQAMYVCNQSSWYVDSDQPDDAGNVQTFPDSYYAIAADNSTTPISGFTSMTSTFSEDFPSSGGWDAGYDLWLKDGVETMIWNQWAGANGFWPTQATTSLTLDGVPYTFLDAGGELEFFRQPQAQSGSVDILAAYDWLVKNGYVSASDVPATLQYGVEISYTSGTETFPMNALTYSLNT